jgi:hypothetical protein
MLRGFTPPYTPDGRSSLVPAPPWHYAGTVLSMACPTDPAAAARFLPQGFGRATGRIIAHVCEWQATTDGWELLDPVNAQYREFILLVEAEREGVLVNFCPMIWVDQDISLIRGWLQGWPKKLGQVWMTRSYGLDHPAAAPLRAGTRMGASLTVKDRRLAEAAVTLDGGEGQALGFLAGPTYGLVGAPSIIGEPTPGALRLVLPGITGRVAGPMASGTAELRFFDAPRDELAALRPTGPAVAAIGNVAITVTGATDMGVVAG